MIDLSPRSPAILRARYQSLVNDVPIALITALCAILIQISAFKNTLDWHIAVLFPMLRLLVVVAVLLLWLTYQQQTPNHHTMQHRMSWLSVLMLLSGVLNFNRIHYLLPLTSSADHYFLFFHSTMYGLCFAFILSRLGWVAYLSNLMFIASAFLVLLKGQIEHRANLSALLCLFEIGMLLAMRTSNQTFDQRVTNTEDSQRLLDENRRLAHQDPLTQLSNRRHFFMRLEAALAQASFSKQAFAVGILDLDNFKPVNDQYGHHRGDDVLQQIANRLQQLQSNELSFYRIGGDEFAFLLTGNAQAETLHTLSKNIHESLMQTITIGQLQIHLGASIGATIYTQGDTNSQSLYELADHALYQAKKSGGAQLKLALHPGFA